MTGLRTPADELTADWNSGLFPDGKILYQGLSHGSFFTLKDQGIQKHVSVATTFVLVVCGYDPKSIASRGEVC